MPNATRHVRPKTFGLAAFGAALVLVALVTPGTEAHKAITSPYNYNDHVFPILRDRCGRCHFPDGPAFRILEVERDAEPPSLATIGWDWKPSLNQAKKF